MPTSNAVREARHTIDDPRIQPCPTTGCWLWVGAVNSDGYGSSFVRRGRTGRAHRLVWERYKGAIPTGLVLDHLCRVRSCVNPDHLRAVTQAENAITNSECFAAVNASKDNCPKCGAMFTAYVHSVRKRTERYCKPCKNANDRNLRRTIKEAANVG